MPEVHFIGTIENAYGLNSEMISITWSIVPGNADWFLQKGIFYGETQASKIMNGKEMYVLNHPIDVQYNTSRCDGWPSLVCEVWDRSHEGVRGFLGCGSIWLPTTSGKSDLEIILWKPIVNRILSLSNISESFLPTIPDLISLRDMMVDDSKRSTTKSDSIGMVSITLYTLLTKDFRTYGVDI